LTPHPLFKAFLGASYEFRKRRVARENIPLFAQEAG
jgi:hypothetical protein